MSQANYQVWMDNQTITETVLKNILCMLGVRGWIKNDDEYIKTITTELLSSKKDDKIFNIKLDKNLVDVETYEPSENKSEWKNFNGNNLIVYLSGQKVTGKTPAINDFIAKYNNYHKIIIVDTITDKIKTSLTTGKYTEIFKEAEFMINIYRHQACPTFTVLTKAESDELLKSYNLKKKEMPRQFDTDPMSRYLFLRREQIVRIVRNSELTCQSVSYRIVVHKSGNAK
jgi:DNA-directed RNA polymerase subunit H (RpoH/RPB5)